MQSRQHENRQIWKGRSQFGTQGEAVPRAGQHDVQQRQIGAAGVQQSGRFLDISRFQDGARLHFERHAHEAADVGVVFDQKNDGIGLGHGDAPQS